MKKHVLFSLLFFISIVSYSQNPKDFLVGVNLDLIKSDNDGYFEKTQVGMELNYFMSTKFTASGGLEVWTREGLSGVLGTRWYPNRDAFIRLRGMLGKNNDVSIGGGWAKPMSETLRFESMADFYFEGNFSIRAGIAMIIK